MVSASLKSKGKWYVAIAENRDRIYNFLTAESPNEEFFRSFVIQRGLMVVAELEGLTEREMDRIIGYRIIPSDDGMLREENAVRAGPEYLYDLVVKLNQDKSLNPKIELEKLYEMIRE